MDSGKDNTIKCVIVGDGAVGKTCLLITYTTNSFPRNYVPTVFDNYAVQIEIGGKAYTFGLFDTAGQEDYDTLRPLSYPHTDIFLVCFSVCKHVSLMNVSDKWARELQKYSPNVPRILVGLQIDLRSDKDNELPQDGPTAHQPGCRCFSAPKKFVTTQQGTCLCRLLGMIAYLECSAAEDIQLKEVFEEALFTVVNNIKENDGQRSKKTSKKSCIIF